VGALWLGVPVRRGAVRGRQSRAHAKGPRHAESDQGLWAARPAACSQGRLSAGAYPAAV